MFCLAGMEWLGEMLLTPFRTWLIFCLAVLSILCAINIFLPLFIVPKFEQIFQDALPGRPLPLITQFIISDRILLALIALAWPIAGIIAVWRQHRAAFWIINLGILFFVALLVVSIIALFMPMVSVDCGLSGASLTSATASH